MRDYVAVKVLLKCDDNNNSIVFNFLGLLKCILIFKFGCKVSVPKEDDLMKNELTFSW
jgi:hypothetical protein